MEMRSIFRNLFGISHSGDGEAKRTRTDGKVRGRKVVDIKERRKLSEASSDSTRRLRLKRKLQSAGSQENPRVMSEYRRARTGNRHRWSGRGYRGAREIHG